MYWRDIITLVSYDAADDGEGYTQETEKRSQVFADVQSTKRAEFYAARQAVDKITVVFLVRAADYQGETRIEYNGKSFDVVRAYTKAGEVFELNCAETPAARAVPQDGTETAQGGGEE